jgi:hypothetical protein
MIKEPQASKHYRRATTHYHYQQAITIKQFRLLFGFGLVGTVRQRLSAVAPVLACARDVRMFLSPETARGREQAGARVDEDEPFAKKNAQ